MQERLRAGIGMVLFAVGALFALSAGQDLVANPQNPNPPVEDRICDGTKPKAGRKACKDDLIYVCEDMTSYDSCEKTPMSFDGATYEVNNFTDWLQRQ